MMKKKNLKVVSLTGNDIITMSKDQAFAYFLGLLEGDGNFYFGPVNNKYISVGGIEKKYCSLAFYIRIALSNDSDLFNEAMLYNLNEKLELKGFINVGKRNYFKITTAVSKDNINCYKVKATSFNNMKTILTFFKGKLLG